MSRGDELHIREDLLESMYEQALPLRVHVRIDLVDQDQGILIPGLVLLAEDTVEALEQDTGPADERRCALAQGFDGNLAVVCDDGDLLRGRVDPAKPNRQAWGHPLHDVE